MSPDRTYVMLAEMQNTPRGAGVCRKRSSLRAKQVGRQGAHCRPEIWLSSLFFLRSPVVALWTVCTVPAVCFGASGFAVSDADGFLDPHA